MNKERDFDKLGKANEPKLDRKLINETISRYRKIRCGASSTFRRAGRLSDHFQEMREKGKVRMVQCANCNLIAPARIAKIKGCPFCGAPGEATEIPGTGTLEDDPDDPVDATPPGPRAGQRTPVLFDGPDDETVSEILPVLRNSEVIYQRSGKLVHVVQEPRSTKAITRFGGARIVPLSQPRLREELGRLCLFSPRPSPPEKIIKMIHDRAEWPAVPVLNGISSAPILRPDGSVASAPGYDEDTGVMIELESEFPTVPDNPTKLELKAAVDALLEVVADFPFADREVGRAAWVAAAITPLARHAFAGPVPMLVIDKNVRGAGGSLLADTIGIITTSRQMPRTAPTDNEEEWRKRIHAIAIGGDQLVLIDNVEGVLGGPALNAALTGVESSDRTLGKSEFSRAPLNAQWVATGNNMSFDGDTLRRIMCVRLESPLEKPEERQGFKQPDLLGHVKRERPNLVVAGLTLLRAYIAAGRPKKDLAPWGSYEQWSDLVRQAVVHAGLADPGETRREVASKGDRTRDALDVVLGALEAHGGSSGMSSASLLALAEEDDAGHVARLCPSLADALAELCPGVPGKPPSSVSLGKRLQKHVGRVVGSRALKSFKNRDNATLWRAERVSAPVSRSAAVTP